MLPLIHLAFRKLNVNRVGSETFRAMNCEMLVSPYHAIIVLVKSGTRLFNLENTSGKSTLCRRSSATLRRHQQMDGSRLAQPGEATTDEGGGAHDDPRI